MKRLYRLLMMVMAMALLASAGGAAAQEGGPGAGPADGSLEAQAVVGTAFTYQGQLKDGNGPVSGTCDFKFGLWDAVSGGAQVGSTLSALNTAVSAGYFTVQLDFRITAYDGSARWLEVEVRCPAGSGSYALLSSRQVLTATPFAVYALHSGGEWHLTGNSATNPATNFIGTTDNVTLTLRVNNLPVLRLEPNSTSPNIIGGYYSNTVAASVYGATISGGGYGGSSNQVMGNYGTISGGYDNIASNWAATVGGGHTNTASGSTSVVAGGIANVASATDATIGGGLANDATGVHATVGGGFANLAGGLSAVIAGGESNTAKSNFTTVMGGSYNRAEGLYATVGGGYSNTVSSDYATVGGGRQNTIYGESATVGGGWKNAINGNYATVSGGSWNTVNGNYATLSGGFENTIGEMAYATVAGGWQNTASGYLATVPGGKTNTASGAYSFAAGDYAVAAHEGTFVWADHSTDNTFTSSANNQFLIQAAGGVGIGTNATVANGLTINGRVIAGGTGSPAGSAEPFVSRGSNSGLSLDDRTVADQRWVIYPNSGTLRFWNGAERLSVSDTGVLAVGALGAAGSTTLCRNASNQIATCSSSLRYKANIAPLALGLETIAQLRPVTFNWKANGEADLGFVAEEVAKVTPLLTTYNAEGQVEGVKYDRVSAVLVNAVQAQQQQITDLQAQKAALEVRLTALEQKAGGGAPTPLATPWPWLALTVTVLGVGALISRRPRQ